MTVRRSGRVWSNRRFKPWGNSEAATVTSRAWLPARRSGSEHPRKASQPATAKIRRTFSSAPHVRARATCSGAGLVLRAIDCATATSALVGRTVTGKLGPRLGRFADDLTTLNRTLRSQRKVRFQRANQCQKSFSAVENPRLPKGAAFLQLGKELAAGESFEPSRNKL